MKGFTYWGNGALGGYVYAAIVWAERHIPFIDENYNIDIESGPGHDTAVTTSTVAGRLDEQVPHNP